MKTKTSRVFWAMVALMMVLPWGLAFSECTTCGPTKVKVRFYCRADGVHHTKLGGVQVDGDSGGPFTGNNNGAYHNNGYSTSPTGVAELELDTEYELEASGDAGCYHIHLSCDSCFVLKIDGVEKNVVEDTWLGGYNDTFKVIISKKKDTEGSEGGGGSDGGGGGAGSGEGSAEDGAQFNWDLGGAGAGTDAGSLKMNQTSLNAASYTPAALKQTFASAQVETIKEGVVNGEGGYIRQVRTPEGLVDVVTVDADTFELRFYSAAQVDDIEEGLYTLIEAAVAAVVWRVELPAGGVVGQDLRISEIRGGVTVVNDFSFTPGSQTWSLTKGDEREEIQTKTVLGNGDVEVVMTVAHPVSGAVSSQTKEVRRTFAWGTEVIERVEDPQGDARTTQYAFYTDALVFGSYTRLKSVIYPDGSWEKLEYFSETVSNIYVHARSGVVRYRMRPWLNGPALPDDATLTNCRVTAYDYTGADAIRTEEIERIESILGVVTAKQETPTEGQTLTFRDEQNSIFESESRFYFGGLWPWEGRLYQMTSATGSQSSWEYYRGTFNANTRSFDPYGVGWAVQTIATESSAATGLPIANRNLSTVSVVDEKGLKAYEETLVYDGTDYQLLSRVDYFYDAQQHLIKVEKDGRIVREQTWSGDRLLTQTDEAGMTTTYGGFDALGRATTVTRAGVLTTTVFDALGRARVVTQTGGGLTLTQSTDYDVSGRITEQTDVNGLTTGYAYSANGRITTVTHPNGSTTITETYLDGQVKSITGTAAVPEFYHYTIDEVTGFITTKVHQSADLSVRWRETTTDWVGNVVTEKRPVQGSLLTATHEYNASGQRAATATSGSATKRFEYDELGEPLRQGLDVNANETLDGPSMDRLDESTTQYALESGVWYEVSTRKTWLTNNSATATTVQTTKRKITGSSATTLSDATYIDDQNQATHVVETVNRATATVTRTTTYPGVSQVGIEISTNGRLTSRQTPGANAAVTFEYDRLGRLWKTTDPRTSSVVETRLYHADTDQLASIATPAGTTLYAWYAPLHANAGQLEATTKPDNTVVRQSYNARGQMVRTWGGGTYPVEWTYDGYGQITAMRTYRAEQGWDGAEWPATVTGGDLTQWHYHEASGLLASKEDAAGESVSYSRAITLTGSTQTRTWARTPGAVALTTTWTYDLAGNLTGITYSDATPAVSITPDRAGRPSTITDAAGTRTLTHEVGGQLTGETHTAGLQSGLTFARGHDAQSRLDELTWMQGATSLVSQSYTYSATTGRLDTANDGLVSVTNRYVANSDLDQGPEFRHNGTLRMTTTRIYDAAGRLENTTSTRPGLSAHSGTAYQFDAASRRKKATHADGTAWDFGYNDRGELKSAGRKWANGLQVSGQQFAQEYDAIGNLATTTTNGREATHTPNALNQYNQRTVPAAIDIIGSAEPTASVTVNQAPATRNQGGYFFAPVPAANSASAVWKDIQILGVKNDAGANGEDAVTEQNGHRFLPKTPDIFTNDEDGNLTRDGRWDYTWDAENRLIKMETRSDGPLSMPRHRIENTYDYRHRRVRKVVKLLDVPTSTWNVQSDTRFLYDGGWNLLAEINATGNVLRSYLWGKDLSGTMTGAGGVGGLLAIHIQTALDTSNAGTYFPAYDGNGNVLSLTRATDGTQAAAYEYGPFGELLRTTGPAAKFNVIRFSTKYEDLETNLSYYGYRFYSAAVKRWLNRDPLGEEGGLNLYGMVRNDAVSGVDYLGLEVSHTFGEATGLTGAQASNSQVGGWTAGNALSNAYKQVINFFNDIESRSSSEVPTSSDEDRCRYVKMSSMGQKLNVSVSSRPYFVKGGEQFRGRWVTNETANAVRNHEDGHAKVNEAYVDGFIANLASIIDSYETNRFCTVQDAQKAFLNDMKVLKTTFIIHNEKITSAYNAAHRGDEFAPSFGDIDGQHVKTWTAHYSNSWPGSVIDVIRQQSNFSDFRKQKGNCPQPAN